MQTIIAAFDDRASAQRAVNRLTHGGFSDDAIHLQSGYDETQSLDDDGRPSTAESSNGFFYEVGNFFGSLFSDAEDKSKSENYAEAIRRGSTVVVVDAATDADVDKAKALLHEAGAVDIDERAEGWKRDGWTGFDANAGQMHSPDIDVDLQTVMPVVQEEMQVGKRSVDAGSVRVVRRVTETPVSKMISLRQERATIERRPVDRVASAEESANFEDQTFEIRERSEQAVVSKTARVVEEVVIGKQITETNETVEGTVRRTDVDVQRDSA